MKRVPAFVLSDELHRLAVADLRREHHHRLVNGKPLTWHAELVAALMGELEPVPACGRTAGLLLDVRALSDSTTDGVGSVWTQRRRAVRTELPTVVPIDRDWAITSNHRGRLIVIEGRPT